MDNGVASARASVITAVEAAFDDVRLEDGVSLHEADAIDNYAGDEERASARATDIALDWRDVPASEIERMHWVWSFFDAKGFRFHLPAAIVWSLNVVADLQANVTSLQSVVWALTPNGNPDHDSLFKDHVRLLSSRQADAIRQFLQWLADYCEEFREDAQQALDGYWNQWTTA